MDGDADGEAPLAATLAVAVVLAVTDDDREIVADTDLDTDADADGEPTVAATLGVTERLAVIDIDTDGDQDPDVVLLDALGCGDTGTHVWGSLQFAQLSPSPPGSTHVLTVPGRQAYL